MRQSLNVRLCFGAMFTYGFAMRRSASFVFAAERSWQACQSTRDVAFVAPHLSSIQYCSSLQTPFRRDFSTAPSRSYFKLKKKHDDGVEETLYRADRVLANRTGKSRSECTQMLKQQRVTIVHDEDEQNKQQSFISVNGPSTKISMHAYLLLDKRQVVPPLPPLLMVFHKPKWVLSVKTDQHGRPCLDEATLPSDIPSDMHPVGRLDYDSSGLLLFSSNGGLTQQLLHPKHHIPKEYIAVVTGIVDYNAVKKQLAKGVETSDGVFAAELLESNVYPEDQVQTYLEEIRKQLPPEYKKQGNSDEDAVDEFYLDKRAHLQVLSDQATKQLSTVRLVVREGKYRMVRRILANAGHPVVSLHRERIGQVSIKDLPVGACRPLTTAEAIWAHELAPKQKKK